MSGHDHRIRTYLRALGALCFEASRYPQLLALFIEILVCAVSTLAELKREAGDVSRREGREKKTAALTLPSAPPGIRI